MGLLNVIRRLALREKLPIREIARRTGRSRNTIKKYLKAGTIEPKFSVPEGRASWTRSPTSLRPGRKLRHRSHASSAGLRHTCTPILSLLDSQVPTTAWLRRPTPKENDWRVFARTTDLVQKLQINHGDLALEAGFSRIDG
jgi:hypothetical protein